MVAPTVFGRLRNRFLSAISFLAILACNSVQAQVSFTNGSPSVLIDFSNTMPVTVGSNPATAFAGAGFQPNTAFAGRLNSNAWSGSGWSDPALPFGGTATGNDYGRGSTAIAVTQGGIYAYVGAPNSVANPAMMFQPGGSDFTPGNLTLRIRNDGSSIINQLAISYKIYQRNDMGRSNSFNLSYSYDDVNYTPFTVYDYVTPGTADLAGWVLGSNMTGSSITGLNIPPTTMFYLRWTSDDVSGTGSRDEIGLDDINIVANYPGACTPPTTNASLNSFTNVFTNQMDVNFTRGNGTGGVLIVASPIALSQNPISGITYTANSNYGAGSAIGNGFVVYSGNAVPILTAGSFTLTNLTPGTNYVLTLFEYDITVPCYVAAGVSGNQTTSGSSTTSATDLFRSKANGNWTNANTWESSFDGSIWINADISPTAASAGITIQAPHTVNVNSSVSMDQVTIAGIMTIQNGGVINLADGTGFDIDIQGTGVMNIHTTAGYSTTFIITAGATMNVATAGKITIGNGASSSGYSPLGTTAGLVTWNHGSIMEWNTTDPFLTSGVTYFPGAGAGIIPIFRVSHSPSLQPGASTATVWNGLMEVNANLTLKLAGTKTFRNGITGTATLTQDELCGQFIINGATAVLGGTGAINLYNAGLDINASVTTLISDKVVNSTLGVGTLSVNTAGSLYCDGYIVSGSALFTLATGCTMRLGSPGGISGSGATGNIQVLGLRTFNTNTNFIYNGTANQITGAGLPATLSSLTIINTGAVGNNTVSLTTTNTSTITLTLTSGLFAAGTGQVLNIFNNGFVNVTAGNFATGTTGGTINFFGNGAFTGKSSPYNVYASGGVNFGGVDTVTIQNGGRFRINTGGSSSINGPFYADGSMLEYNTGFGFNVGPEWQPNADLSNKRGGPFHVNILATGTTVNFAGTSPSRTIRGDLNISSGAGLTLSTISGGDLNIAGNWTRAATGTFTSNARMVTFNGTGANQTVTVTGGGTETFAFLTITKPDAFPTFIMAAAPNATNITVNGNSASGAPVTTLLLSGNIELNQNTFNFTSWNGNQNHIRIDNLAGASTIRNISSAGGQGVFAIYNAVANNSTVEIFRTSSAANRRTTLVFGTTVKVTVGAVAGGTGGIDFGNRTYNPPTFTVSGAITTINGTLQIDTRGYVAVNAPTYGAASTLIYNTTGTYNRYIEWGNTQVQPGYPNHVIVQNNSILNLNNSANPPNANRYLAGNLTISTGSSLILNNTGTFTPNILTVGGNFVLDGTITLPGTLPAFGEDLHIVGNWTRSATGVFNPNDRAVYFEGGINSTITANGGETFPYLRITKSVSTNALFLNSDINITKEISITSGIINLLNNNVNIKSDPNYTASITAINPAFASVSYGGGTGTGRFVVERYIPTNTGAAPNHGKTWQFLAIPTNNAGVAGGQTVNAGWQEGNAPLVAGTAGLGTIISSNIAGTGFDIVGGVGPSMKTYDPASTSWKGITRTDTTLYNKKGYMIFVRGDRTVTAFNGTATPTNLRSTGKIMEPNNLPPTTTVGANQFESVGNPYASAIDFSNAGVVKGGTLQNIFYVWDPRLGGAFSYGGYQTCIKNMLDANYTITPGGGSYGVSGSIQNLIQSGQAFFVRAGAGGGTIGFNENAKVSGSSLVTRQVAVPNGLARKLTTQLYAINGNTRVLVDGVINEFGLGLSSQVDLNDAIKMQNTGENLGIVVGNDVLSVERRGFFRHVDSIRFTLNQLRAQQQYQLEFTPFNIAGLAQKAMLVDNWLGTFTPVSLSSVTTVDFTITADRGSYAADRFMIVFGRSQKPFLYSNLKADREENSVKLQWNSTDETEHLAYEIQRSADGVYFTKLGKVDATGNEIYSWEDLNPLPGQQYYRINIVGQNRENYSNRVTVLPGLTGKSVNVFPNPVKNHLLRLYFNTNMKPGICNLSLYNSAGVLVWKGSTVSKPAPGNSQVQLPVKLAKGNYQLEIQTVDSEKVVLQVFID